MQVRAEIERIAAHSAVMAAIGLGRTRLYEKIFLGSGPLAESTR